MTESGRAPPALATRGTYDTPWKTLIQRYFRDLIALVAPDVAQDIDWTRPIQYLDTELQQLVRDARLGRRHADVLVRVQRRGDGVPEVLIHVEVQAERESDFEQRLFVYSYRIFDRYRRRVYTLGILADDRPSWRPRRYEADLWGVRVHFGFPTVKLLDFEPRRTELQASDNPVAWAIAAHLHARATIKRSPEHRLATKLMLARSLYEHDRGRDCTLELLRFLDWIIALPASYQLQYHTGLRGLEEERTMAYLSTLERFATFKGRKQGRIEGLEQGLEQGLQRGEAVGAVCALLRVRLPEAAAELSALARQIEDVDALRAVEGLLVEEASEAEIRERLIEARPASE